MSWLGTQRSYHFPSSDKQLLQGKRVGMTAK